MANFELTKITRFQSVARFGFEFSPKIANFGVFDRFLAKNALELSGDAVPTEHQIHRNGVIFTTNLKGVKKVCKVYNCRGI